MSNEREFKQESTWRIPEDYYTLRDSPLILPERSKLRISNRIIELVNSYRRASRELQTTIPPLREEDILVCIDESLIRYQRQLSFQLQHSLRVQAFQDLAQKTGIMVQEVRPMILTEGTLPGKPILYPGHEIAGWSSADAKGTREDARQAYQEITTAKVLAHENWHRATKILLSSEGAVTVSPSDPLYYLAFATDRLLSENAASGNFIQKALAKRVLKSILDPLKDYAQHHNPAVLVEGARIFLFCDDIDGTRRVVAESGYDLNEMTVDLLTLQFMEPIWNYMRRKYLPEVAEAAIKMIMQVSVKTLGSVRFPHLLPKPFEYFSKLNLAGPMDVMSAYVNGEIPQLHARLLPKEEYFA